MVERNRWPATRLKRASAAILIVLLVAAEQQPNQESAKLKDNDIVVLCTGLIGLVGGILGGIAFFWRYQACHAGHLLVSVECEKLGSIQTLLTQVENKHEMPKEVDFACLLIGPEAENSLETLQSIATELNAQAGGLFTINVTDLDRYRTIWTVLYATLAAATRPVGSFLPFQANGRALIPLPFHYDDNEDIADETLRFRLSVSTAGVHERRVVRCPVHRHSQRGRGIGTVHPRLVYHLRISLAVPAGKRPSHGSMTTEPVVLRPSRSRCTC